MGPRWLVIENFLERWKTHLILQREKAQLKVLTVRKNLSSPPGFSSQEEVSNTSYLVPAVPVCQLWGRIVWPSVWRSTQYASSSAECKTPTHAANKIKNIVHYDILRTPRMGRAHHEGEWRRWKHCCLWLWDQICTDHFWGCCHFWNCDIFFLHHCGYHRAL